MNLDNHFQSITQILEQVYTVHLHLMSIAANLQLLLSTLPQDQTNNNNDTENDYDYPVPLDCSLNNQRNNETSPYFDYQDVSRQKRQESIVCSVCKKCFSSQESLRRHSSRSHKLEVSGPACNSCNKRFKNANALKAHLRLSHKPPIDINTTSEPSIVAAANLFQQAEDSSRPMTPKRQSFILDYFDPLAKTRSAQEFETKTEL